MFEECYVGLWETLIELCQHLITFCRPTTATVLVTSNAVEQMFRLPSKVTILINDKGLTDSPFQSLTGGEAASLWLFKEQQCL